MKTLFFIAIFALVCFATSTDPFVTQCLTAHNNERAALGIKALTWSTDLASTALSWAKKQASTNTFAHSTGRSGIGENIAKHVTRSTSVDSMLKSWTADERKYYIHRPYPDCSTTGTYYDVGDYTQIIWQTTTEVGCGVATGFGVDYLVCQYRTSGNKKGLYAYDKNSVGAPYVYSPSSTTATPTTSYSTTKTPTTTTSTPSTGSSYSTTKTPTTSTSTPSYSTTKTPTTTTSTPTTSSTTKTPTTTTPSTSTSSGSGSFIQTVLDIHNAERNALGLPSLTWAADLAGTSQSWCNTIAARNSLAHSTGRVHIGENVAYTKSKAGSVAANINLWLSEKAYFINGLYPHISTTGNVEDAGHYSQIVWRTTTQVGCGQATNAGHDFLVCQYRVGGNSNGVRPY